MKEITFNTKCRVYQFEELNDADKALITKAKKATYGSYAPYSRFYVGAAIAMADGSVVEGANQENAAYPSGTCAERTAAYYASASHPDTPMKTIAIAARCPDNFPNGTPGDECFQLRPISPCGACRQALLEYEHLYGPMRVLLYGKEEIYEFPSVASLLPYCFTDF